MGYDRESYLVGWVLQGAHVERLEDLSFDCQRLWYTGVAEWWSRTGLDSRGPIELNDDGRRTTRISYTEQDPLVARLEDAELSAVLLWHDVGSRPRRQMEIREELLLRLRSDAPLGMEQWRELYEGPLRELLTLATGRTVLLDRMVVESPGATREIDGRPFRIPLEIHAPQHEPEELSDPWHVSDMLFSLDDIAHDLGGIFQRWTEVRNKYTLARQLYFSSRYAPYIYKQTLFVHLVQACESYHALRFKRRGRKSPDEHAQAIEEVLAAVPQRHVEWVEERLRPRPTTLADRLLFLCRQHEAIMQPLLADTEEFCRRAAVTRHYLTHGTRQTADVITDMRDIVYGCWVLRILFEACLLCELGIIPDIAANPFEGTSHYEHLKAHPLALTAN